jgi:hypothetical protein
MAASLKLLAIVGFVAGSITCGSAFAGPSAPSSIGQTDSAVQLAGSKSKGAKVKGYVERRGGYSYNQADSINTYGDSRSNFGGAISLRDPSLDKQTNAGPFDHGFFFDSGTTARGGDSPYMN